VIVAAEMRRNCESVVRSWGNEGIRNVLLLVGPWQWDLVLPLDLRRGMTIMIG
jgi:hypothetical protein